jgi:3-hydroxyisobutyrate dehydrogenase
MAGEMVEGKNSASTPLHVAVLGAGTMGSAMATRLLAAGMRVAVWSRHSSSTDSSVKLGATSYEDVKDAAAAADVVITMLPTLAVTNEVMFEQGAASAMRANATWLQMATIGARGIEQLAAQIAALRPDIALIDAPVSGSRGPAEAGELLILASSSQAAWGVVEPIFRALGTRTMWLGPLGAGSRMKLVLNTLLAFQIEGIAEVAALARRLQVDPAALTEALRDSPLASSYAKAKLEKMLNGDDTPEFSLDLALKDLDLATAEAGSDAVPIARAISDRWRDLVSGGASGRDVSAARRGLGEDL